jgi:hypothetical protein
MEDRKVKTLLMMEYRERGDGRREKAENPSPLSFLPSPLL